MFKLYTYTHTYITTNYNIEQQKKHGGNGGGRRECREDGGEQERG